MLFLFRIIKYITRRTYREQTRMFRHDLILTRARRNNDNRTLYNNEHVQVVYTYSLFVYCSSTYFMCYYYLPERYGETPRTENTVHSFLNTSTRLRIVFDTKISYGVPPSPAWLAPEERRPERPSVRPKPPTKHSALGRAQNVRARVVKSDALLTFDVFFYRSCDTRRYGAVIVVVVVVVVPRWHVSLMRYDFTLIIVVNRSDPPESSRIRESKV